ncbi:hypothetical protein L596_012005 [Steinernema carpocapsae]|uniref:Uncharacterized protein n=1 Tax=Steinernema carpocapsae TaxID=34508 RepID=A0A4U5NVZ7_STECR|nr:hypothetical protein L596_012005 [Steinernema carpocapsae]
MSYVRFIDVMLHEADETMPWEMDVKKLSSLILNRTAAYLSIMIYNAKPKLFKTFQPQLTLQYSSIELCLGDPEVEEFLLSQTKLSCLIIIDRSPMYPEQLQEWMIKNLTHGNLERFECWEDGFYVSFEMFTIIFDRWLRNDWNDVNWEFPRNAAFCQIENLTTYKP